MSKRFTDTEKWKDPWFQDLSGELKLFYFFVLDNCDCAGIWKINFKLFSFQSGFMVTKSQVEVAFKGKIEFVTDEIAHVTKFIDYQYGKLNPEKSNAHKGVVRLLDYHGLKTNPTTTPSTRVHDESPKGDSSLQDKDKEQDQVKAKAQDKEKASVKKKTSDPDSAIEATRIAVEEINRLMGTKYSAGSKSTTQAVRKLLNEGFTLEDLILVVNDRYQAWGGDPKMAEFVAPENLFRPTKFEDKLEKARNSAQIHIKADPDKAVLEAAKAMHMEAFGCLPGEPLPEEEKFPWDLEEAK